MPELRNISSRQRGRYCEQKVKSLYLKKGFSLVSENRKYLGVEVDLLFLWEEDYYLLLEVKSLSDLDLLNFRLQQSQKKRLEKVAQHLEAAFYRPVEVRVVYVLPEGAVIDLSLQDIG